jgi:tetratricopeptide (TPR) repeat protein
MSSTHHTDALNQAVALHREGRLDEAEKIYRALLEERPRDADLHHLLGLIASAMGRHSDAVRRIGEAIAIAPKNADFHNNLGNALFALGQLAPAELSFHESIRLDPGVPDYYGNLGRLLQHLRRWGESESAYRKALDLRAMPEYRAGLGNALLAQGRAAEAEQVLRQALDERPDSAELLANLAGSLIAQQRLAEAEDVCRLALAANAASPSALHSWGQLLALRGQHGAAIDSFERARAAEPDNPDISLSAASSLIALQRWAAAERALRAVVMMQPRLRRARFALARVMLYRDRAEQAIELLTEGDDALSADVEGLRLLALAQRGAGKQSEAAESIRKAIRLDPASVPLYLTLGNLLQDVADLDGAVDAFGDALRHDPGCAEARVQIAACRRYESTDHADAKAIERRIEMVEPESDEAQGLHFALGKIMGDCGDYDRAWENFGRANALRKKGFSFDPEAFVRQVQVLRETCSREWLEHLSAAGDGSEEPVFIVGMPQAGGSLLDRLLSDHPGIGSVGAWDGIERLSKSISRRVVDRYPRSLATLKPETIPSLARNFLSSMAARGKVAGAMRICNSANGNIMYLGLIAALFPAARILHCQRDARDTCLANFFQPHSGSNDFASDLEDLACCHRVYDDVVSHWQSAGIAIRQVQFEHLVGKPEKTLRAVLTYLGVDWNDECMSYFETRTAGRHHDFWRLEQPYYPKTPGNWKRYRKHLDPLTDALAHR